MMNKERLTRIITKFHDSWGKASCENNCGYSYDEQRILEPPGKEGFLC